MVTLNRAQIFMEFLKQISLVKLQSSQLARFSTYKTTQNETTKQQYHFKAPQVESHDV